MAEFRFAFTSFALVLEFDAVNRMDGTSVMLSLAVPLSMKLPAGEG